MYLSNISDILINAESNKSILYSILNTGPQNMLLQADITDTQFTLKLQTLYHTFNQLSGLTTQF
jgi:hypothetical protein